MLMLSHLQFMMSSPETFYTETLDTLLFDILLIFDFTLGFS